LSAACCTCGERSREPIAALPSPRPRTEKGEALSSPGRLLTPSSATGQHRTKKRLKLGNMWEDWGLLFCAERGAPWSRQSLTRCSFKPLLKRAGLPDIRFHDLRHTCATLLLSRGHHPKLVQELLGHASVAITLDRYSHVLPGISDQTAAAMESALS
jgi:integrase